ncbi:protein-disulfide reductase DsbD domain-containing protein, partial [Klebsiella pneumoniae]|uniref:protein-disulfide reductase DsbD domain-containing protein n=1 Tax=Klebsiella pneumoniae TaxID=573 RepID=UPI003B27EE5A
MKYQGCADAGVCYPPQTRTLKVALPGEAGAGGFGCKARGRAGEGAEQFLAVGFDVAEEFVAVGLALRQRHGRAGEGGIG